MVFSKFRILNRQGHAHRIPVHVLHLDDQKVSKSADQPEAKVAGTVDTPTTDIVESEGGENA